MIAGPSACLPLLIGPHFLTLAAAVVNTGPKIWRVGTGTEKLIERQAGHLASLLKPHVWRDEINVVKRSVSDVPPRHQEGRRYQNPQVPKLLGSMARTLVSS